MTHPVDPQLTGSRTQALKALLDPRPAVKWRERSGPTKWRQRISQLRWLYTRVMEGK